MAKKDSTNSKIGLYLLTETNSIKSDYEVFDGGTFASNYLEFDVIEIYERTLLLNYKINKYPEPEIGKRKATIITDDEKHTSFEILLEEPISLKPSSFHFTNDIKFLIDWFKLSVVSKSIYYNSNPSADELRQRKKAIRKVIA